MNAFRRAGLGLMALVLIAATGCAAQVHGWSGTTISGSTAYVMAPGQKLLALNLDARSRGVPFPAAGEWQYPPDKDTKLGASYSSPVVAGDTIYLSTYQEKGLAGSVLALDPAGGQKRWEFLGTPPTGNFVGSPTVIDGIVYIASLDHNLYAVNRNTGEQKWVFETGGSIASAPVLYQGLLYFGASDGNLYAVDAASGTQKWSFPARSWLWASPLLYNGVLYVGSLAKQVFAIDAATGQPRWAQPFATNGQVSATPVIASGTLVVADHSGRVYGIDPATGARNWDYVTDPAAPIYGGLASDSSRVYLMSMNHKIDAINASTGRKEWGCPTDKEPYCQ